MWVEKLKRRGIAHRANLTENLEFAKWMDINANRNGADKWTWKGNNWKVSYTTKQMFKIFKTDPNNEG